MINICEGRLPGLTITGTNFEMTPNCRDEIDIKAKKI